MMDKDLNFVLALATQEELRLMHSYAQLHQADVACTPAAIAQVMLDLGYNNYQSSLCHIIHHLDGTVSVNDPAPEMEATMLCLLFNQALARLSPQELVELKRGMHRFGLRAEDWKLVMMNEQVAFARLKPLLMAGDYNSYQLTEELARVIFAHLLAQGDPEGSPGMMVDGFAHILFGVAVCMVVDAFNALFGVDKGKLIPLALHVAIIRRRNAFRA